MLSRTPLTNDQARHLVEGCFLDLKARAEHGFVPETSRPDIEIAEQRDLSRDFIRRRLEHIETQSYPADVRVHAMVIARKAGISFRDQPASMQLDLMEGVARAEIERTRLQLFRLDDRLSPFAGFDPLFALTNTATAAIPPLTPAKSKAPGTELTLGQLVETYLSLGTSHWVSHQPPRRWRN
ncbi:hypothetical protein [uncultured Brevundimonas sp.]|uniref:hypothetical protein n=1 Tax=uncultured Brevundimonas sp. TaxID=213418 RepID=UPI0025D483AE|nr:hypothetical protein [uncultured Brevundimonas sp.]